MTYSPDSLTIQIGRTEDERSFVWLQDGGFSGAHLDITTLAAYERDGGFTDHNTTRYPAEVSPVRMREPFASCRVRVSGLTPDRYIYRVGCDTAEDSEAYRFTVRAGLDKKQTFFLYSDLHFNAYRRAVNTGDPTGEKKRAEFEAMLQAACAFGDTPDFLLSIGDNISVCNMPASFYPNPEEFSKKRAAEYAFLEHREFLSAPTLKSIPFASVMGNHDSELLREPEDIGQISSAFFQMPNDDGFSGHYDDASSGDFYFVSGRLLVVGINAMVSAPQNCKGCEKDVHRAFIERAVAAHPDAAFRILLNHVPAYSYVGGAPLRADGTPTETAKMAAFFHELCEGFGFDVVFSGHQHAFSRTYPLLGGRVMNADLAEIELLADNCRRSTVKNPKGIVHYNVPAAMPHSFNSGLPDEPDEIFESYAMTERYYKQSIRDNVKNIDKYKGTTYPQIPTFAHATLEQTVNDDVLTVNAVAMDGRVFDTLIIKKTKRR